MEVDLLLMGFVYWVILLSSCSVTRQTGYFLASGAGPFIAWRHDLTTLLIMELYGKKTQSKMLKTSYVTWFFCVLYDSPSVL